MKFYFIRHGETIWNKLGKIQGWEDSPLTIKGAQQSLINGQYLNGMGIELLLSSPLGRAATSAQIISRVIDIEPTFHNELKEMNFGQWSEKTFTEIKVEYPELWDKRNMDIYGFRNPDGESYRDVEQRGILFIDTIMEKLEDTVAIVSHEGIEKTMIGYLLDMPKEDMLKIRHPQHIIYFLDSGTQSYGYINTSNGATILNELVRDK
ncbi:MAG: histidine phosphatase family protein [Candidatus Woesearchaeota archaeon]